LESLEGSSLWDNVLLCSSLSFSISSSSSSSSSSELISDLTVPQNWEQYLCSLLELLEASLRNPVSNTQIFLGVGLNLFQRIASRCPSTSLQEKARTSLSLLELLLHPSTAPFHSIFLPKDSSSSDISNGGVVGALLTALSKPVVFELKRSESEGIENEEIEEELGKKRKREEEPEKRKDNRSEISKETPKKGSQKVNATKETPKETPKKQKS